MITPKNQICSLFQTKIHRNKKTGSQQMHLESLPYENQNSSPIITNPPASNYDNLRALMQSQTEDDNILPFKLPQIGKKYFDVLEQPKLDREKGSCDNLIVQQLKRLQENPYLKKYVGLASKEKLKRDNSCSFLNIVSVKPVFRSSTRMGTSKDTNMTITQQKTQKLISYKPDEKYSLGIIRDIQRIKTTSHAHNSHISETSASKRSTHLTIVQKEIKPTKKLSLLSKEPLKSLSIQKKLSLKSLRLEKPKQSPNYSEWCTFFGMIDGAFSEKEGGQYYKAFVGKGNNSVLVKNIIKNRPWWTICQEQSDAHLYWTQARSSKYLQALKEGKKVEKISWESQPNMRMQLFGNCQNCINDKVRQYIGIGFQKVLSKTQRQILSRSSINLLVPAQSDIMAFDSNQQKSHNHLEFNWNLSNKKALYYNLKSYYLAVGKDPFEYIPETYHIQKQGDAQWANFLMNYEKKTLWIVKPGENSNRGCGIDVVETIDEIKDIIKNKSIRPNGKWRSHIVQRYLMPFLYNKRKFDIRSYMLVTASRGNLRCYWYEEGYIRTASKQFTTKNLKNRMIHLTNDAVQKHSEQYGKYESGNKLSFNDFNKYVKNNNPEYDFYQQVYPRMMELAADAIRSTHLVIDAKNREFSFQIFGLDFMIDDKFQTWLIEVNTNPCLQLSCPLLARIIPSMVQNAFKIAVDPIFPPPKEVGRNRSINEDLFQSNKFTLIFSSREESDLQSVLKNQKLQNITESEDQDESTHEEQE